LEQQTEEADGLEKRTTYGYSKHVGTRTYPVSVPTSTRLNDNKTSDIFTTSTQYDDYGNIITSTDKLGATTSYTYDPVKKWVMTALTLVDTGVYLFTAYERNEKGDITSETIRKNDASGDILQQVKYGGYDGFGNSTTMSIANGNKSVQKTTEYSSNYSFAFPTSQYMTVTDASNMVSTIKTRSEYDPSTGQIIASIEGKDETVEGTDYRTQYQYDKIGRIKVVKYPGDKSISVQYDDLLNTSTFIDELGYQTLTKYNGMGWKEEEGFLDNIGFQSKNKMIYDTYGRVLESHDALGNRTQMQYDSWGRILKVISQNGTQSSVTYDDKLRKVTKSDALGYKQIETYNKNNQLITLEELSQFDGQVKLLSTNVYNPYSGQLLKQTDAKQGTTSWVYDIAGQLRSVTNAKLETTSYEYDLLGNLTKMIYPDGNTKSNEYDELGRLIRSKDSRLKEDIFFYDANNNRIKMKDKAGQEFNYTYNKRNLLMTKQGPSEKIAFTYYDNGSRATMTDGIGTTNYFYKPYTGELNNVVYPDGKTIGYTYDIGGNRETVTTPFSDTIRYKYNNMNQLENVQWNDVIQESYTYYDNGQLSMKSQVNGMKTDLSYINNKLTSLKQSQASGNVLSEYTLNHDPNRNIKSIVKKNEGAITEDNTFTYDPLNRINSSTKFDETYSYDNRGNRLTLSTTSNVGIKTNSTYEYDEWDRLKKVTINGNKIVEYRYNGDNLLVERKENGITTRYYYDGKQIVAEGIVQVNGTVTEKVSYLWGNGLVMQENKNNEKGYYLQNWHGDVVEIRNATGALLNKYDYDLWGNILSASETVNNSFRYSSEYWDESTDLQYLRARWYDPSLGRFINQDTYEGELTKPLTLNLYTYVLNNPLSNIDPSGNYCVSADGKWAHGNECSSGTSLELGENDKFIGSPIIENGIITGYLGKSGPFRKIEFNYWSDATKGLLTGSSDAILGKSLSDQLMKNKPIYATMPALGPAAGVSGVRFPSTTSKILAGAAKLAGPVTVVLTGVDVYKDFQEYNGDDRWYAASLTVAGTGTTIIIVTAIGVVTGGSAIVVIGAGAAIGAGVNYGVNMLKDKFFK